MRTVTFVMALGTPGAAGCASIPLPADEVAHFEATVEEARAMGAFKLPADPGHRGPFGVSQSKEHMLLADDELAVARDMAGRGDARAVLFLARAQSDVDLAMALAREEKARLRRDGTATRRDESGSSDRLLRHEGGNR